MQALARPMLLTEKIIDDLGQVTFEVQAVVRKKIIFSTRPTPLKTQLRPSAVAASVSQGEKRRKLN